MKPRSSLSDAGRGDRRGFDTANRLSGLEMREFQARSGPRDRAWEVTRDGGRIPVFLGDSSPGPANGRGLVFDLQIAAQASAPVSSPIVVINVCNFTAEDGRPAFCLGRCAYAVSRSAMRCTISCRM